MEQLLIERAAKFIDETLKDLSRTNRVVLYNEIIPDEFDIRGIVAEILVGQKLVRYSVDEPKKSYLTITVKGLEVLQVGAINFIEKLKKSEVIEEKIKMVTASSLSNSYRVAILALLVAVASALIPLYIYNNSKDAITKIEVQGMQEILRLQQQEIELLKSFYKRLPDSATALP